MEQSKLTQEQISEMSEVVAKYMGYEYSAIADIDNSDCGGIYDRCKVFAKIPIEIDSYPDDDQYYIKNEWFNKAIEKKGYLIDPDYLDWNKIHEVWEKLRKECTHTQRVNIKETLSYGTKEQTFTALYNAIKFIQDDRK
jgi:hypothetical protein